jgi:hypothetical protein
MKKIKKTGSIFIFAALLLNSCGNSGEDSTSQASTVNEISTKQKSDEKSNQSFSIDLSTPSKAIESFISSSQEQNAEKLSECFSANCEREFQMIVKKEMKEKDLKEYKEFCTGAKVIEEKIEGNGANVKVKFSRRDEDIKLELVDGKWKIVAF